MNKEIIMGRAVNSVHITPEGAMVSLLTKDLLVTTSMETQLSTLDAAQQPCLSDSMYIDASS